MSCQAMYGGLKVVCREQQGQEDMRVVWCNLEGQEGAMPSKNRASLNRGEANRGQRHVHGEQDDSMMTHRPMRTNTDTVTLRVAVMASDCRFNVVVSQQRVGCRISLKVQLVVQQCREHCTVTQMRIAAERKSKGISPFILGILA